MNSRLSSAIAALLMMVGASAQVERSNHAASSIYSHQVSEASNDVLLKYVQSRNITLSLLSLREIERRKGAFAVDTLRKIAGAEHGKRSYVPVSILKPNAKTMSKAEASNLRAESIKVLGRLGSNSALATIRTAATSKDPKVSASAIRALGMMGDASSIPIVLKGMASKDAVIRSAATRASGGFKDERISKALRKILDGKDDPSKLIAMTYLALAQDRSVMPKLEKMMQIGNLKQMTPVRQKAGEALLYLDAARARELVEKNIAADRSDGFVVISTHGTDFGWIPFLTKDPEKLKEYRETFRARAAKLLRGD